LRWKKPSSTTKTNVFVVLLDVMDAMLGLLSQNAKHHHCNRDCGDIHYNDAEGVKRPDNGNDKTIHEKPRDHKNGTVHSFALHERLTFLSHSVLYIAYRLELGCGCVLSQLAVTLREYELREEKVSQ